MLIVDEGSVGPQLVGDFLARKKLAGPVEQHEEHLEGLGVQLDAQALTAKFSRGGIHLKDSEAITRGRLRASAVFRHGFQTSVADEDLIAWLGRPMENFSQVVPIEELAR